MTAYIKPSFSFLIPAYNSENTIVETLVSIETNSDAFGPVDVYISNNCSTDSTLQHIQCFQETCDRQRINPIVASQSKNLGAYGNVSYLVNNCKTEWAYILCADDTLNASALEAIQCEINSLSRSRPDVAMIAFRNTTINSLRQEVETENGSPYLSGKRGLLLFFLYGSIVGTMSNACIRCNLKHDPTLVFDTSFQMGGDFNYYVTLLLSGFTIYLSSVVTNYARPGSPLSAEGGRDCKNFHEKKAIFNKCLNAIAPNLSVAKLFLKLYAHLVLYYQFYRIALKCALRGRLKGFRNISVRHRYGSAEAAFWCFLSIFMMPRIFRTILRRLYLRIYLPLTPGSTVL